MAESCAGCGTALNDTDRFCAECGTARAPRSCPACGAESSGGRFCAQCGSALSGPEAVTEPAGPAASREAARVSERRLTSILFGDLVGFTTLSESRDPEEVRELLSRYFAAARTVIARYGGTVEKFIGDAVMAVWGVPTAHEDDAERAVRAGLELTAMVAALGEEVGVEGLMLRVGVVTGEVAVTIGATQEGMVAGDAVNTAARVQSAAAPGTVWVDELTRGLTASAIDYTPVGEHALKGKAEAVLLFHARSVVAAVGGVRRADGLEAPFTGRERQFRLVKDLLHETIEERRPRLVLVSGPAGVGKSRLAWEFEKYVDGLADSLAWHRGRSLSYGGGVAFRALWEVVRSRLGLTDADGPEVTQERLAERLPTLIPDVNERTWVAPRVAALVAADGDHGFAQDDLFAAWTLFLERAGVGNPVVIVLEDLHHADDGLLDFLAHLLGAGRHGVHVVALARPELLERRPELFGHPRVSMLHLEPMPDPAIATLLDGLVEGLPADVRDALVVRAEGIPLYAVETVRALIDRGLVVAVPGGHALAAGTAVDVAAIGAPASLQAVVASRLDALPPSERRLVSNASVLGLSFDPRGLRALDHDAPTLDDDILALVRRDVLAVQSDRFAADHGQLQFVQSVVRQVAYEMLSRRDRRALHVGAADYLAGEENADELSALIAQHLLDAADATGSDDSDAVALEQRAVALLRAAAARARGLGVAGEAVRYLRMAVERCKDDHERLMLDEALVQAAYQAGDYDECLAVGERVRDAVSDDDPVRAAPSASTTARALVDLDRVDEATSILVPLLNALDASGEGNGQAALLVLSALIAARRAEGDSDESIAFGERQLQVAESLGDIEAIAGAMINLAIGWSDRGQYQLPLTVVTGAIELARRIDTPNILVRALLNRCALLLPNDLQAALEAAREAVELGARSDADWRLWAQLNYGSALFLSGRWGEARGVLAEAIEADAVGALTAAVVMQWIEDATGVGTTASPSDPSEVSDATVQCWAWQSALNAARRRGDLAAASHAGAQSVTASNLDNSSEDFSTYWHRAVVASLDAGDLEQAREQLGLVQDAPQARVPPMLRAQLLRMQGLLAIREGGDPEQILARAIGELDAFGLVPDAARCRHELAGWLLEHGRGAEAIELLDAARTTYEQIGAAVWLAELDALMPAQAQRAS